MMMTTMMQRTIFIVMIIFTFFLLLVLLDAARPRTPWFVICSWVEQQQMRFFYVHSARDAEEKTAELLNPKRGANIREWLQHQRLSNKLCERFFFLFLLRFLFIHFLLLLFASFHNKIQVFCTPMSMSSILCVCVCAKFFISQAFCIYLIFAMWHASIKAVRLSLCIFPQWGIFISYIGKAEQKNRIKLKLTLINMFV